MKKVFTVEKDDQLWILAFLIVFLLLAIQILRISLTKDVAGNEYKTIKIGGQIWMKVNLNVDTFRNGDPIPETKTDKEWSEAGEDKQPAWCYYNNDPANGIEYGKLYNWFAVNDPRGLAPAGSHIPTYAEWTILTYFLKGERRAGTKMKAREGWISVFLIDGNGNNSSGFWGLPGGQRYHLGFVGDDYPEARFQDEGFFGSWWSSTEISKRFACSRYLYSPSTGFNKKNNGKGDGLSVRCLMD